ncbi:MAG: hypothetical protein HYZ33_04360, partial [Ignavibacteriales bacterium]|nr:hypothetical protein [Ignavibacteriales bacterium]
ESEWSVPTTIRTVNFASLSPGSYRFVVRAVNSEGVVSDLPAILSFSVLSPFWQQWWFISLGVALIGSMFYSVYRIRLRRLMELENLRRRIAQDLHDDIGADLTQIAIFSEVIKTKIVEPETNAMLERIGTIARRVIGGMSELVWYIDPRHDSMQDLIYRIEELAGGLLHGKEIRFSIECASQLKELKLLPELRKELFLILKEAFHNAVRYAECTVISLSFQLNSKKLAIQFADNGKGIGEQEKKTGHGLVNMQKRAEACGGKIQCISETGAGTRLVLEVPLTYSQQGTTRSGS